MPDDVDLKEFVSGFVLESDERLHAVNRNLVAVADALGHRRPEPGAVRELFRSLHTIKGLASMVGAEPIVELAHEMEGILRTADRGGGRLSERALDLLVQGTRALEERVHAVARAGLAEIPPAPPQLLAALAMEQEAQPGVTVAPEAELDLPEDILHGLGATESEQLVQAADAGLRTLLVEFQPSPERAARGLTIGTIRERVAALGELVKIVPRSSAAAPTGIAFALLLVTRADDAAITSALDGSAATLQPIQVKHPSPPPAEPELVPVDHSIRVDVRRLDDALERLSDLVVTRFRFARASAELGSRGAATRELDATIADMSRQLRQLRAAITAARMIPVADLLQRLPLVIRGLTRDTHKAVELSVQAGAAEIDKAVADRIFPAIIHLVRNAVDHGIEAREERRRARKPETGSLRITCDDSSGTSLVLSVSDDGRGIDRAAIAARLAAPVAGNDGELLQQITTPGLSTRDDATRASGRGMGMDIVKRTVELLGGVLSLRTAEGQGTAFTLRVPVSVTIIDVFGFVVAEQVFVAPVAMVDEIIELDPSRTVAPPAPGGVVARLVRRRGEAIPLFGLASVLRQGPIEQVPAKALVVARNDGAIAFGIDRMVGQHEVVVRPLDRELVNVAGITGATDLGDGRPTLVLDLLALGAAAVQAAGGIA